MAEDFTKTSVAVATTLSFCYTTVLQIRLCGMTYGQLSADSARPSIRCVLLFLLCLTALERFSFVARAETPVIFDAINAKRRPPHTASK